jgi:hypothetical protein
MTALTKALDALRAIVIAQSPMRRETQLERQRRSASDALVLTAYLLIRLQNTALPTSCF